MLMTKAMREREERQRCRKYKFSVIRIKFPDNIILQGTFSVHEKYKSIVDFVHENLAHSERSFHLRKATEEPFNDESFDKTLLELVLYPAVLLIFSYTNGSQGTSETQGYLKEELLCYVQPI